MRLIYIYDVMYVMEYIPLYRFSLLLSGVYGNTNKTDWKISYFTERSSRLTFVVKVSTIISFGHT